MHDLTRKRAMRILAATAILLALLGVQHTGASTICPGFCRCDVFEEQNRANCSAKHLVSANLEMERTVQLLDLSVNGITILDKSCFQTYAHLTQLNLSHNAIGSIYTDTFRRLRRLTVIDLSYNRLESFDSRLFESNVRLRTLRLAGNMLTALRSQTVLLRSASLQTLDLRNAQLTAITPLQLSELPQLLELDVSQNLMIVLDASAFLAAPRLQRLELNANRWNCDNALKRALMQLQKHHIDVTLRDCIAQSPPSQAQQPVVEPMFERMQALPAEEAPASDEPATMAEPHPQWRSMADDDEEDYDYEEGEDYGLSVCYGTRHSICQNYQALLDMINRNLEGGQTGLSMKGKTLIFSEDDLKVTLIAGIVMGTSSMLFLLTCALCLKRCSDYRRTRDFVAVPAPAAPSPSPPASRPTTQRVRPSSRRCARPASEALVRHDELYAAGNRDNFIARLFARPARRQYYRTTTLIRRLSRSNLFLNRLGRNDCDDVETAPVERPETPPPKYGDVVPSAPSSSG